MIEQLWSDLIEFTSQFVIPDWGALIALLPIFLAIPVFLYITWTIYRWATAGPTRRGKRRLEPAPPPGIHMPGPSFAPFLGAAGVLFLGFGIVFGGLWLLLGAIALTITLLYWGREALRDYDHIPAANGEQVVVGMLPAPAGTPPEGVHIPPPSFRPVLVAVAMTMLVAGIIVGGWAFVVGAAAVVITGVGWLLDARREYTAVEASDHTGHLDSGSAPSWPKATFAALAVLIAVGLVFSSGLLPNSGAGAAPSGAPAEGGGGEAGGGGGGGAPADSAAPSAPATDVVITAEGINFTTADVTAPAAKPFTIGFDNKDTAPHDVVIKDGSGATAFQGDIVTGPAVAVYDVPALPAGSYTFVCSVHPNMTGTLTAK
jgi:plastocyanin